MLARMDVDALLNLSRRLHAARDLDAVMAEVAVAIREATRYRRAWMAVRTADGERFRVVGDRAGGDPAVSARLEAMEVSKDPYLQRCVSATAPFVIDDLRRDPDANQDHVEALGPRTVILVPMVRLAERVGAFVVGTYGDAEGVMPPTPGEYAFIIQVASLVSVVVGRIHAEEQRAALERQVGRSQRLEALGRLAGGISHDFNNLLVTIMGNAELALDLLEGHPAEELVVDVKAAADRAAALTRQLLAFSRGQPLDRRPLDVAEVIGGTARFIRRLLPTTIALEVVPPAEPSVVLADRGQLEQVLVNLAVNARDAMPSGGRLTFETRRVVLDADFVATHPWGRVGDFVVVSAIDTGRGVPPELRERIFEPFFSSKPASRGTGLGLAVVDTVARQHNGFVRVRSGDESGSAFDLYLPRAPEPGRA
ncbi:MAG: sensor histidine kinase [Deltaproteobacteria bacterium]|nr:MAG: sensor histidine kinase [Deltaproteobacteria bacterium]